MKKLMFAAALAATGMTFAAKPVAQVYDVSLSIKSTAAATATVNNKQNPIAVDTADGQFIIYRKQASYSWKGLIWGCGCETIDGVWEPIENTCEDGVLVSDTVKGCILWDTKTKGVVFMGNGSDLSDETTVPGTGFGWDFIHAINKDGKQVEGAWTMEQFGAECEESEYDFGDLVFSFKGAGFGSAYVTTEVVGTDVDAKGKEVSLLGPTCLSYIKSINGNFAGAMRAPLVEVSTDWSGCTFCGFKPGTSNCDYAIAWDWCKWDAECDCAAKIDENLNLTAAYGTWKISYNSGLSQKLGRTVKSEKDIVTSITDVYKFPDGVYAAIKTVEAIIKEEKPEGCDEATADYEAAQREYQLASEENVLATENLAQAYAGVASVSAEQLNEDLRLAQTKIPALEAAVNVADTNYNAKVCLLKSATNELAAAEFAYTGTVITVSLWSDWGASPDFTTNVTGYANLMAQVPTSGWSGISITTNDAVAIAKSVLNLNTVANIQKLVDDAKAAVTTAEANVTAAAADIVAAKANLEIAKRALAEAKNEVAKAKARLDNITALQAEAANNLLRAQNRADQAAANLTSKKTLMDAAEVAMKKACGE